MIITLALLLLAVAVSGCGEEQQPADTAAEATVPVVSVEPAFDYTAAGADPIGDPSGPYYHQVYKAVSADGINYTRTGGVVLDKASVPDAVSLPDGRLVIYAVDGSGRSESGLMVAISEDKGATWKQGSLQLEGLQPPGKGVDPNAVVTPEGAVRLYYVVFPRKMPIDEQGRVVTTGEMIRIKSAVSTDGVNFKEEEGVRYQTAEMITDPDTVKIRDKWYMYVSMGPKNVALSSNDGMTFNLVGPIREQGSVSRTVPVGDGRYRQYFCREGIASAISADGLTWTDEAGQRLEADRGKIMCDPAPVKLSDGWLMFYKVGPAPVGGPPPGSPPPSGGQQPTPGSQPPPPGG